MSLLADALDDDVTAQALADLRAARRRNRIQQLDKFDAFYKAYVSALLAAIGLYAAAGALGDKTVTPSQLHAVRLDGPVWVGLLAAVVVAVGLRSGGRGGPLAFERADVRHVLLAPVDRRESIRKPALRQIRHMIFVGVCAGAAVGLVTGRRMPQHPAEWVASGAGFGLMLALLAFGAAMICGGYRLRTWITDLLSLVFISWSVIDVVTGHRTSPFTYIGSLPLWPVHIDLRAVAGIPLALVAVVWGVTVVNRCSIEAAERRSRLVGQLRFAATMQDIRTVMVLQRQLSQEQMRQRPWFRLPRRRRSGLRKGRVGLRVFLRRGFHGTLRWPVLRLARLLVFAAVGAFSVVGIWAGTSPLVVTGGIAMWLAALDVCEPLAQEIDHPDRGRSMPHAIGQLYAQSIIFPMIVLALLSGVSAVLIGVFGNVRIVVALWPVAVLVASTALAGATMTVNARTPSGDTAMVDTPETASMKFAWRVLVPPGLGIVGFLPIVVARKSWVMHHDIAMMVRDVNTIVAICITASILSFAWLRYGDQFRESMAEATAANDAKKRDAEAAAAKAKAASGSSSAKDAAPDQPKAQQDAKSNAKPSGKSSSGKSSSGKSQIKQSGKKGKKKR